MSLRCSLLSLYLIVVGLLVACEAKDPKLPARVWMCREDHGDKPGVEWRVREGTGNSLLLEVWLYVEDGSGKDKERAQVPIKITRSSDREVDFEDHIPNQPIQKLRLVFSKAPSEDKEPAVLKGTSGSNDTDLVFERQR